ncbi:beta-lactamase family protein [Tessaracoccus sp. SD287]|uniref:serine hydrolase domain-containing protein n=1 Tax=Tessaracoccus sp. SD287 TaxID=2782008 RepID=UPI001A960614|nr:serine hydrolase domain-containing protein [Tessaracoccus sp. SD287]MBO1030986.1 beta-lactamase family protein [Tessaracoccus sp. SD287]
MSTTAFFEQLTLDVAGRARAQRQPSLSVAAALDGDVIWTSALGDADPLAAEPTTPTATTCYRIGSLTTPQVAVAVMVLAEGGQVDLGAPIRNYLPDAPAGSATVAQFLSHTSGLVAEIDRPWWARAGGCSWDELVAMNLRQVAAPGLAHHYSNVGYAVLGRLLEVVTGKPWDALLAEVLWTPLGMSQTARSPGPDHATGVAVHPLRPQVHAEPVPPYLAMGPAAELWSTPTDLARLGSFLAGVGQGRGVLRPESLALMRHPAALATAQGGGWTSAHGLGLMVRNTGGAVQVFHAGSVPGFTAHLVLDPASGTSVAVCGNSTSWNGGAFDWLQALSATVRPHRAASETADGSGGPMLPPTTRPLAGLWYRGPQPILVKVHQDVILVHPTEFPDQASRVRADAGGRLVGVSEDAAFGEELTVDPDHPEDPRWFTLAGLHHARAPYDPDSEVPGGVDEQGWRPLR